MREAVTARCRNGSVAVADNPGLVALMRAPLEDSPVDRDGTFALLKAFATFLVVCMALDVVFDVARGRFSMAGPLADALWVISYVGPLAGGMAGGAVVGAWVDRHGWSGWAKRGGSALALCGFLVGLFGVRLLVEGIVRFAPEEISQGYDSEWKAHNAWRESQNDF